MLLGEEVTRGGGRTEAMALRTQAETGAGDWGAVQVHKQATGGCAPPVVPQAVRQACVTTWGF